MKSYHLSRRCFLQSSSAVTAASILGPGIFQMAHATPATAQTAQHYTACDNCNQVPYCGMKFTTTDGIITSIEPWGNDYPNGPLCSKAYASLQRQYHPGRLLYPMKRTAPKGSADPKFVRVSWDEAYQHIAKNLLNIKKEHGPEKVFFYCGDPKEPRTAVRRLASLFGSVNFGTESSTNCAVGQGMANDMTFGSMRMPPSPPPPGTKVCLIWGTNPAHSNTATIKGAIKTKEAGCKFIAVDPRATATAGLLAEMQLQPKRTAATAALAHGIANVMITENLHDAKFCAQWIHGYDQYREYIKQFTPEKTEEITGVPAADIIATAKILGEAKDKVWVWASTQGTTHDRNAVNNQRGLCMLFAITGAAKPFPGKVAPNPLPPGMDDWYKGDNTFCLATEMKAKLDQRLDLQDFPAWAHYYPHVQTAKLVEYIRDKKVRAFAAWGFNAMIWAQSEEYAKAIETLDFAMATDYFYRPYSHKNMDILLPAATNFERYAPAPMFGKKLYGRTPIKPLGEAREDWQIAMELAVHLGYKEEAFNGNPIKAMDSIFARWGLSYADLQKAIPAGVVVTAKDPEPANKELGYPTPSGKIEAYSLFLEKYGQVPLPEYKVPYQPSKAYPLLMISGARRPHMTHSKTRNDTPWLMELESKPYCDINPKDAQARKLQTGDPIVISSQWGTSTAYANVTSILAEGVIGMIHGWGGKANINQIIPRAFDPISGYPPLKEIAVQITKVESNS